MANLIEVSLTPNGIKKAKDELKKYRESLSKRAEKAITRLVEMGYEFALNELNNTMPKYNITQTKIDKEVISKEGEILGRIYVIDDDIKWIEFGTGVMGNQNPHPAAAEYGWNYNPDIKYYTSEKTGKQIPYTNPVTKEAEGGWWYWNEKKSKKQYTLGLPSNPIMYNTRAYILGRWKEVFDEYMKGEYTE